MMLRNLSIVILLTAPCTCAHAGEPLPRFDLRAGDRVVLIGDGLIEQERRHGFLEARLSRHLPEGELSFRNFGWAGDTVRGSARTSGFQNPEGFARLLKELQDSKPSILFVGYGMNESFDGPAGLAGFRADYAKLLSKLLPLKARHVILLSPIHQEDLGRPFPDPAEHNRHVDQYAAAIKNLAAENKIHFVDLASTLAKTKPAQRWTTNGLQLNEAGSSMAARAIEEQLRLSRHTWRIALDASARVIAADGAKISQVDKSKNGIRFLATDAIVPAAGDMQFLQVLGLPPGKYALSIDGRVVSTSAAWQRGVEFAPDAAAEALRRAIVVNNDLFYRRWRPFNDHSRHWGFIGGDGKLYDQQIAEQARTIAELRRPRTHQYEIVRIGDTK